VYQTFYAVKVGNNVLPERFSDPSSAEQKKTRILEETHGSVIVAVVPVDERGHEILLG